MLLHTKAVHSRHPDANLCLSTYYRNLYDTGQFNELWEALSNKLVLGMRNCKAGLDKENSFLGAAIDDDNLPWDVNEREW
jgi:hypothetical protein